MKNPKPRTTEAAEPTVERHNAPVRSGRDIYAESFLAFGGVKEELVEGIRMLWSYETITHAPTRPIVSVNEPANIRGH